MSETQIVVVTLAELRQLVREEIREALAEHPAERVGRWVDVQKAAEHFDCTPETVRNWIKAGAPARQVGAADRPSYRIDLAEFDAWARSNHQKALGAK